MSSTDVERALSVLDSILHQARDLVDDKQVLPIQVIVDIMKSPLFCALMEARYYQNNDVQPVTGPCPEVSQNTTRAEHQGTMVTDTSRRAADEGPAPLGRTSSGGSAPLGSASLGRSAPLGSASSGGSAPLGRASSGGSSGGSASQEGVPLQGSAPLGKVSSKRNVPWGPGVSVSLKKAAQDGRCVVLGPAGQQPSTLQLSAGHVEGFLDEELLPAKLPPKPGTTVPPPTSLPPSCFAGGHAHPGWAPRAAASSPVPRPLLGAKDAGPRPTDRPTMDEPAVRRLPWRYAVHQRVPLDDVPCAGLVDGEAIGGEGELEPSAQVPGEEKAEPVVKEMPVTKELEPLMDSRPTLTSLPDHLPLAAAASLSTNGGIFVTLPLRDTHGMSTSTCPMVVQGRTDSNCSLPSPTTNSTSPSPANSTGPSPANSTGPLPANSTGPSPANSTGPSPANGTGPSPANSTGPLPANSTGPSPANGTGPSPANSTGPSSLSVIGSHGDKDTSSSAGGTGPLLPAGSTGPLLPASSTGPLLPASSTGPLLPASSNGPLLPASSTGPLLPASSNGPLLPASSTGPLLPASSTGPLLPASSTGPLLPASSTGPLLPASSTGPLLPASSTGPLLPASSTGPLLPASSTGPLLPASSTGPLLPASSTGPLLPASSTGPLLPASSTGPLLPASSNGPLLPASSTGPLLPASSNGPLLPASSTGPLLPASSTGPLLPASSTGPLLPADSTDGHSAPVNVSSVPVGCSNPDASTNSELPFFMTDKNSHSKIMLSLGNKSERVVKLLKTASDLGLELVGRSSTGVFVKDLVPGGPAHRAGQLTAGDQVVWVNDVNTAHMASFEVKELIKEVPLYKNVVLVVKYNPTGLRECMRTNSKR